MNSTAYLESFNASLKALHAFAECSSTAHCALRLAYLTLARPSELLRAEWIDIDVEEKLWRIPAERSKCGRIHLIPLSRPSLETLNRLRFLSGRGRLLFPSVASPDKTLSEIHLQAAHRKAVGAKWSIVDIRRKAEAILRDTLGYESELVQRQLRNHLGDDIFDIYKTAAPLHQRAILMQAWADYLDELRAQPNPVAPWMRECASSNG